MYKDYEALLKSVASTYDRAQAPAKRQPTRSAERTDIWDANVTKSFHEAYEFGFDIDTLTDIVQAHMCDQLGVIPKETFSQLSPESRKVPGPSYPMTFGWLFFSPTNKWQLMFPRIYSHAIVT
jgi:hypothetical protein